MSDATPLPRQTLKARYADDGKVEVGLDEAGRGPLWGPMTAGAVVWPAETEWTDEIRLVATQIQDSKKLTPKRRAYLEERIKAFATAWAVGRVEAAEIDALGMSKANRLAFVRAIDGLHGVAPQRLLIDGCRGLLPGELGGREQVLQTGGDHMYLAIAAASILAKEEHDRIVRQLCEAEPGLDERYGLLSSKGYGTAAHQAAIRKHGMHAQHRRLFLRKLLGLEHTVSVEETAYDFLED